MITIQIKFRSNGEEIKRTAILNNTLSELSKSTKNQATDIVDNITEDGFWSIIFSEDDSTQYEIEFAYNQEEGKTFTPIKAITWVDGVVDDAQKVTQLKIK